jgi:hypothetical protein
VAGGAGNGEVEKGAQRIERRARMPGINEQIKRHALESESWQHHSIASQAYAMFDTLNAKLFKSELPQAVIGFADMTESQKANIPRDVIYYYEGDTVSLAHHIDLRPSMSGARLLMALLKGMVLLQSESYQEKPSWYYSAHTRMTMGGFGISIDKSGDWIAFLPSFAKTYNLVYLGAHNTKKWLIDITTEYVTSIGMEEQLDSLLESMTQLLGVHAAVEQDTKDEWEYDGTPPGEVETLLAPHTELNTGDMVGEPVDIPQGELSFPPLTKTYSSILKLSKKPNKGTSKMKKWGCKCTTVRCATGLIARCDACGASFQMQEP